jgi:hypothetical protein
MPVWKTIQPKLEAMLEDERKENLKRQHETRLNARRKEFKPIWYAFLAEVDRTTMPAFLDTVRLPSVAAMLDEDSAQVTVTQERWEAIKESCLLDVDGHRLKIIRDLQTMMKKAKEAKDSDKSDVDDDMKPHCDEQHELDVASDPTALFNCCYNYCKQLNSYPALLHHSYADHNDLDWSKGRYRYDDRIPSVVSMVLRAVGLPQTTTRADLDKLDGRFVCLCGHPKYRKPLTFVKLVRKSLHITSCLNPFTTVLRFNIYLRRARGTRRKWPESSTSTLFFVHVNRHIQN